MVGAIYVRVSTKEQTENPSADQLRACEERAVGGRDLERFHEEASAKTTDRSQPRRCQYRTHKGKVHFPSC
jgi:DNA invertase Pin-like site-specific DNA recombinase